MIEAILKVIFGSKFEKDLKENIPILHKVNQKELWAMGLKNEDFKIKTEEFKKRLENGEDIDSLIPETFALAREASRRTLGERPYDTQILGAIALHQGRIMELKTGEGKTLSSVPAAYLNALTGKGVHIVTVNDYLAKRDALWMKQVYDLLGIELGYVVSDLDNKKRKEAYHKDITYITNNELGFDYLRDNMRVEFEDKTQRHNYYFCIIDEIDSILIDEARTPLIISGVAEDNLKIYQSVNSSIKFLIECEKKPGSDEYNDDLEAKIEAKGDYKIDLKNKKATFTDEGLNHLEKILNERRVIKGSLFEGDNVEYIHHATQALKAHYLFQKEVDYVVKDGKVEIVDEFTGRILKGRRYSDGLHQAIEAKERVKIAKRNRTIATTTFQNFFRMYDKISGMTGTAETEAKEFKNIYNLDVCVIPTNRPLVRADLDDVIYIDEESKFNAIVKDIKEANKKGQPVLVGTISIENSEKLSKLLIKNGIKHEVLNAKNHSREALIVAEAGSKNAVTIATNMAGRGTDIKLGGNYEFIAKKRLRKKDGSQVFKKLLKEEYKRWLLNFEEVKNLGGLYILGTERHESRRIDNQLRGRSGRQGDPGKSKFFISMDDELIKVFSGNKGKLKAMLSKVGVKKDEALEHGFLTKTVEGAQKKVESRNFEIRKHLLDFDDVLSKQRSFLYKEREDILKNQDALVDRILDNLKGFVDEHLKEYTDSRGEDKDALRNALDSIRKELYFYLDTNLEDKYLEIKDLSYLEASEYIYNDMKKNIYEKEKVIGKEQFSMILKYEYVRHLDHFFQEHLENLNSLREAVYLRTYAQKTPLTEYKLEGSRLFEELVYNIKVGVLRRILAFRIVLENKK